eukprot:g12833.t1
MEDKEKLLDISSNRRYLSGKMDLKKDTKGGRQVKPNSKTNFELDTNKSLGPRSKPNGTQHPGSPTGGSGLSSIALQYSRKQTWNNSPKTHAETVGENLQLQYEERQRYIKYAAILAKGGIHGRLHSPTIPDNTGLLVASFYHGKPWRFVYIFIASLNMLLAIWEESTTIFGQRVRDTQQSTMVIRWIEMFCLAFFSFDVYLLYLYKGREQFFSRSIKVRVLLIIIMAINSIICMAMPKAAHISRILRPFILIERLRNVRKIFFSIVESTPKIFNVIIIVFLHVLFFGTIGHILFRGIDEHGSCKFAMEIETKAYTTQNATAKTLYCSTYNGICSDYFNTISASFLQMFILLTTANYPDIMMPVYRCSNWSVLFFAAFLILGLYILMSLVLAVIYTHFSSRSREKYREFFASRKEAFILAHKMLYKASFSPSGTRAKAIESNRSLRSAIKQKVERNEKMMSLEKAITDRSGSTQEQRSNHAIGLVEWTDMCLVMNKGMPLDVAKAIFWMHDKDNTGLMSTENFGNAMKYASLRATAVTVSVSRGGMLAHRASKSSLGKSMIFAKLKLRNAAQALTGLRYFDLVFDILIVCNGIVIVMLAMRDEIRLDQPAVDALTTISTMFVYIFATEVVAKIVALGFKKFWRVSWFNRIDFFTVQLSLMILLYDAIFQHTKKDDDGGSPKQLAIAALLARLVRILRIMDNNAAFRRLTGTIIHVIPALWRFFGILFIVMYMFAILGMECFGHTLKVEHFGGDKTKIETFKNSSYFRLNYHENNFDDFPHAMVTLFEQMVVNNWPIVMEGAMASNGWVASIYFIAFYLVCVVCIMNVLVAFLIDAYQTKEVLARAKSTKNKQDTMRLISEKSALPKWHKELLSAAEKHNVDLTYTFDAESLSCPLCIPS